MFGNLIYKFKTRNSNKRLKANLKRLDERVDELQREVSGNRGIIYLGMTPPEDNSLLTKINNIHEYLGVEYSERKLAPKPKEEEK